MRLLHAADIHLDSPQVGLARYDEAPVAELRSASRRAYDALIELAIEERVDAVLLAGDIFDGDWAHWGTGRHFVRGMQRLGEAGIPAVGILGNHDAESKLTRDLAAPANLTMLGTRWPETWESEELGLAVHGQSYATPAMAEDLAASYPAPRPGMVNVGLLHTSADGGAGEARYAPTTVRTLAERGYDYFALGHIHTRAVLWADPPVVFPGVLQGRGLRETGPKGATLVEIDGGEVRHEHRVLDVVRWERLTLDASRAEDLAAACAMASAAVRDAARSADGRLLALQLRLAGTSPAHGALVADPERTRQEMILAAAEAAGEGVWLQGTVLDTVPEGASIAGGDDAVGELLAEIEAIAGSDRALEEFGEVLRPVAGTLTPGVLAQFNPLDPAVLRELLEEVRRTLPAALTDAGAVTR